MGSAHCRQLSVRPELKDPRRLRGLKALADHKTLRTVKKSVLGHLHKSAREKTQAARPEPSMHGQAGGESSREARKGRKVRKN